MPTFNTYPDATLPLDDGDLILVWQGSEVRKAPRSAIFPDTLDDYADDTAAATGLVPVGGYYRTGSAVKRRIA